MKTTRHRCLLAALGLGCLTVLSGCSEQEFESAVLLWVLYAFATFAGILSAVGIGLAVKAIARRSKPTLVHLVLSGPFAVMAVLLHAIATEGFTYLGDKAFGRGGGWLPGSASSSSHLSMEWLLVFVGAPLVWFAASIICTVLAPIPVAPGVQGAPPAAPPLNKENLLVAVMLAVVALGGYAAFVVRSTRPEKPVTPPVPAAQATTVTSAGETAPDATNEPPESPPASSASDTVDDQLPIGRIGTAVMGEVSVSGGGVANARAVASTMGAGLRRCYQAGLRRDRNLVGSAVFVAEVGAQGQVVSVDTSTSVGLSAAVLSCANRRVSAGQFTPPEGGSATVRIPVTFTSQ